MDIRVRFIRERRQRKWIAEVWSKNDMPGWEQFDEPYPEETYAEMNKWCMDSFGYHARTAYHIFEFKKKSELDWFMIRWS